MPTPVTVPLPVPDLLTVSRKVGTTARSNCAFTVCAAVIVTLHAPAPLHPPPLQPMNVEPAVAVAVSATTVLGATDSLQSAPQAIPVPITVPAPVPDLLMVSRKVGATARSNCAFTVCAALTVTLHVAVPLQPPPLQPTKVEPAVAAAVRVTTVLGATDSLQSAPQAIPVPVTVPAPVPVLLTVNSTLTTGTLSVTQVENSDVPLTACVAVVLMNPVVSAEAKLAVPAALPEASVVTLTVPRYTSAPPWLLALHDAARKNSSAKFWFGSLLKVYGVATVTPLPFAVASTG